MLDSDAGTLRFGLDPSQPCRAPRDIAVDCNDGEKRLAVEADLALDEKRIVAEGRRDVVLARDVRGRQYRDDARKRAHRIEIERQQSAARDRRLADGDMQGSVRFADIVDVVGRALHMLDAEIVRKRLADVTEGLCVTLPSRGRVGLRRQSGVG